MLCFYDKEGREIITIGEDSRAKGKPLLPQDLMNKGPKVDSVIVAGCHLPDIRKLLSAHKLFDGRCKVPGEAFIFIEKEARVIWYNWEWWHSFQEKGKKS